MVTIMESFKVAITINYNADSLYLCHWIETTLIYWLFVIGIKSYHSINQVVDRLVI